MCGICGIAGLRKSGDEASHAVLAMRESLHARGPDDAGLHLDEGIALGVRRLVRYDLPA